MAAIRVSKSNAMTEMVKIELEVAEALAGLAHFSADRSDSRCSDLVSERVLDEFTGVKSWFEPVDSSFAKSSNTLSQGTEKSCMLTAKSMKNGKSTGSGLNSIYPKNNASTSGRKSRQSLTEAEMEARKIRRVLANRESARQTIRRRQAMFEELTRKAADLAWVNDNLKKEKEMALKEYQSLKSSNESLKTQMNKTLKVETEHIRQEGSRVATNERPTCSSSTNSPFIIYNQQPFFPLVWPSVIQSTSSVQLQCGSPAGIVFPSHVPISAANRTDSSSSGTGNSMMVDGAVSPLLLLPCPWLFTLPQNDNERPLRSFNLNDKPKESSPANPCTVNPQTSATSECQQFFAEKEETSWFKETIPIIPTNDLHGNHTVFPPDGGGQQIAESNPGPGDKVYVPTVVLRHDDTDTDTSLIEQETNHTDQGRVVCSLGKRSGDMAAAEARKRRKQLTRLKNNLHFRHLKMH